ncbi:MAG: HAD-IA family hydrolase [Leptolyngbya sp. SIO1D8]|nr:HAD-IA family hydrolase [Leptolyngbya sp. SIO1D8]
MNFTCKAIVFDLDGVLVDSNPIAARHWQEWAKLHGLPVEPILASHHGRPTVETVRQFAPHLDAVAEASAKEIAEADDTDGLVAYEGAFQILLSIPAGRWTIATSGTRRTATFRLQHVGLPIPDNMVTADDVECGKPAPDPYLLAIARLGIAAADCVVVEDAPSGITAAKLAGAQVIGIASTNHPTALSEADAIAAKLSDLQIELVHNRLKITATNV